MTEDFDVIVWGATGFTGQLVAEYIAENYGVNKTLRWAIAGRQREKLEALRAKLISNIDANSLPILIADSNDRRSLDELVDQTKVLCTTVGPYSLFGTSLVEACIESGTDYCDLTGEVQWMHRIIQTNENKAPIKNNECNGQVDCRTIPSRASPNILLKENLLFPELRASRS